MFTKSGRDPWAWASGQRPHWLMAPLALIALLIALIAANPARHAGAAGSVIFDGSPGTAAPPANLGPYAMTPFATDLTPDYTDITTLPAPGGGTLTFTPDASHRTVPDSWQTWSHGYTGDVYASDGETQTMLLPENTSAFYFYAEPDGFGQFTVQATASDGTTSGPIVVEGDSGATYFGFYTTGTASLTSITVTAASDAGGFAVSEFGIAIAETATVTSVSTAYYDWAPVPTVAITATVSAASQTDPSPSDDGWVTFYNGSTLLCTVPLQDGQATCVSAIDPSTVVPHSLVAIYSGATGFKGNSSLSGVVPQEAQPTIVSIESVFPNTGNAWLIDGAGFSGASSVTVCGTAVPFTVINDNLLLTGVPAVTGPKQCTITITAAGGTGSSNGTVTVVPKPVPGSPVVIIPTSSGSTTPTATTTTTATTTPTPTTTPTCTAQTLTLSGQWTLIAWPGADAMPVSDALAASADGCTTDITSQVSVIWGWDAVVQQWHAYFPSDASVPGANDLTTLSQGAGYFVALANPAAGPVVWKVETGA